MKTSQSFIGATGVAFLASVVVTSAAASPRAACSVVPLAEVRAILGAPVVVLRLGNSPPTVAHGATVSHCSYGVPDSHGFPTAGTTAATLFLSWPPHAELVKYQQFYEKRHKEAPGIKGDVFVLSSVTNTGEPVTYDKAAEQKLLAAALAKL